MILSDYIQCFLGFFSVALLVLSSWHQMKQEEPATSPCSRKSWSLFMGFQWDINGFSMGFNARSCYWRIGASRLLGDTVGITNGYNYGDNLQSWDIGLFAPLIAAPLSRPSTMPCRKWKCPKWITILLGCWFDPISVAEILYPIWLDNLNKINSANLQIPFQRNHVASFFAAQCIYFPICGNNGPINLITRLAQFYAPFDWSNLI